VPSLKPPRPSALYPLAALVHTALTLSRPHTHTHTRARAQVAERSLFLWNHEYIITLVAQYRAAVLPIVFGALEENAANHWNPAVHGLTCNVRKMFMVSVCALREQQQQGALCVCRRQQ
jgi:Protein phosphatase 2A regulatory B subunit (B56 family)